MITIKTLTLVCTVFGTVACSAGHHKRIELPTIETFRAIAIQHCAPFYDGTNGVFSISEVKGVVQYIGYLDETLLTPRTIILLKANGDLDSVFVDDFRLVPPGSLGILNDNACCNYRKHADEYGRVPDGVDLMAECENGQTGTTGRPGQSSNSIGQTATGRDWDRHERRD